MSYISLATLEAICSIPAEHAKPILDTYPKDVDGCYRVPVNLDNQVVEDAAVFLCFEDSDTYYYEV